MVDLARGGADARGGEGTDHDGHGPKYLVNIEGVDYHWEDDSITAEDIRTLAGFPAGTQVIEVNLDTNDERTLPEGEPVELKPGHGFGKKIRFQRG